MPKQGFDISGTASDDNEIAAVVDVNPHKHGKYLAGTVNEISYFALTNDPAFCQLFFPTYGILAWYDVGRQQIKHGEISAFDVFFQV